MENNTLSIVQPENIQGIVQNAPEAFRSNQLSRDNCLTYGRDLLALVERQGMTDELDQRAAVYIEKSRKTLKVMNDRRSPLTKLFDEFRRQFTAIENDIDPAKKDTVPYRLQLLRNQYAAAKRAQEEKRQREEQARREAEAARIRLRTDIEDDLRTQFRQKLNGDLNNVQRMDGELTLDNLETIGSNLSELNTRIPVMFEYWAKELSSMARVPLGVTVDEYAEIQATAVKSLLPQFREQYTKEMDETVSFILDRLPSKKKHLEEMAKADAEQAARMKAEMEARQREEAARMEAERQKREAEEKARADAQKQAQEMNSLFNQQAAVQGYQPKAKVSKKIRLLNPEGAMPVVALWWSKQGCTLTVDELEKMFSKQIRFCEKLAETENILVQDESVEYVDEVKAK